MLYVQDLHTKHQETDNVEYIDRHSITRLSTHSQGFSIPSPKQGFKRDSASFLCSPEKSWFFLSAEKCAGQKTIL